MTKGTTQLNVTVPDDLAEAAKVQAIRSKVSLKEWVAEAIRMRLESEAQPKSAR